MEIINLAIFSHDNDYSLALGEALSMFKSNFIVRICRKEEELFDCADFDLAVLDSDCLEIDKKIKDDKRVIKLAESKLEAAKGCDSALEGNLTDFALYKYSNVKELSAGILLYYGFLTGKRNFLWTGEKAKMIAFCSAKGGVGKTTLAFGVAQAIRRYYAKRVLYLSMEEIESTLLYMPGREDGFDLCAYLYYMFNAEKNKPGSEAFMLCDKFDINAFMPGKGINMLRDLDIEKMGLFFREISENGAYDYILIDMGENFGEKMNRLFNFCHKIIAISSPHECGTDERERRFLNYLRFVSGEQEKHTEQIEQNESRIIPVLNMVKIHENIFDSNDGVYVEFDPDSIDGTGELIEISIDSDFGAGIKRITKQVI